MSLHHEQCYGCGVVTKPFWILADRHYCRTCVTKAGGGDLQPVTDPLVEEIRFGYLRAMLMSLWSALVMTGILSGMIVTLFLALGVMALLAKIPNAKFDWIGIARVISVFVGVTFSFIGIIGVPVALIQGWLKRPRQISTEGDAFVVNTAYSIIRIPFADCTWSTPKLAGDGSGFYFPGHRAIVICSTDVKNPTSFACGFTEQTYRVWKMFVSLQGIPFEAPTPLMSWVTWLGSGAVGGGMMGALTGAITSIFVGKPIWITVFGFLGFLDGCVWGLLRTLIKHSPLTILRNDSWTQHLKFCRIGSPLIGFFVEFNVGIIDGINGAIAAGTVNAIVMAWIAWNWSSAFRKRLESEGGCDFAIKDQT